MIGPYRIHGHAIVSADDRIAGAAGRVPSDLRNEADWARFQAALDGAVVSVLGRAGHEANPNFRRRNRLILSSGASGIERRSDGWWWNPAEVAAVEALAIAAPGGGIAAVPGGRRVFDLFLDLGFDEFHLARASQIHIPDGVPVFSAVARGETAAAVLAGHGLSPGVAEDLDPAAGVFVTVWRRDG